MPKIQVLPRHVAELIAAGGGCGTALLRCKGANGKFDRRGRKRGYA